MTSIGAPCREACLTERASAHIALFWELHIPVLPQVEEVCFLYITPGIHIFECALRLYFTYYRAVQGFPNLAPPTLPQRLIRYEGFHWSGTVLLQMLYYVSTTSLLKWRGKATFHFFSFLLTRMGVRNFGKLQLWQPRYADVNIFVSVKRDHVRTATDSQVPYKICD